MNIDHKKHFSQQKENINLVYLYYLPDKLLIEAVSIKTEIDGA